MALFPRRSEPVVKQYFRRPDLRRNIDLEQDGRASFCLYTVRGHVVPQQAYRFPRVLGKTSSALNAPREAIRFFEHDKFL